MFMFSVSYIEYISVFTR